MLSVSNSLELCCFENRLTELVLAGMQLNIFIFKRGREGGKFMPLLSSAALQRNSVFHLCLIQGTVYHTTQELNTLLSVVSCMQEFFCFLFPALSSDVPRELEKDL